MSKINNTHTFAAAAFGAAALFSMLSFGSSAEAAKSVASCQGASTGQVVSCCERIVEHKGLPFWMIQTGGNCEKIVKCGGKGQSRRCYVQVLRKERDGGNEKHDSNNETKDQR